MAETGKFTNIFLGNCRQLIGMLISRSLTVAVTNTNVNAHKIKLQK